MFLIIVFLYLQNTLVVKRSSRNSDFQIYMRLIGQFGTFVF